MILKKFPGRDKCTVFLWHLFSLFFHSSITPLCSTSNTHTHTHTHMYTHMVEFSAIEHISWVSYCAEVCVHIFQHQYRRKLSSLLFFPLVILNNATLQFLGGKKALPVPNTGKSRWKKAIHKCESCFAPHPAEKSRG